MDKTHLLFHLLILLSLSLGELVTGAALVGGAIALGGLGATPYALKAIYCRVKECCREPWVGFNFSSLNQGLEASVFGQHIVNQVVYSSIHQHITNKNPRKALVLSFHGWRGTGKNHVSDMVAKHLYKKGVESKYVHKIIASHEYTDKEKVRFYREQLKLRIVNAVKECPNSLFIIDEIEKMPAGVIDAIKPFTDYHQYVEGLDFRHCIFLFLGNVAGGDINEEALSHIQMGKYREQLTVKDMHYWLSELSLKRYGGLEGASIVQADLVDWFVPFLPLEREHVKLCARAELMKSQLGRQLISEESLEKIADEFEYRPKDTKLFSFTGCKRIDKIVERFIFQQLRS